MGDAHGSRLLMRPADAARWSGPADVVVEAELAEQADAVVSLGGDGTMLGALRLVARRPMVTAASEPLCLELQPGSGRPAIEVDGTMLRRMEKGQLDVRLQPACDELAAPGGLPGSRPPRALEP